MGLKPRFVGLLATLALLPVLAFAAGRAILTTPGTIITAVNVLLIVASLFLLFGPSPGGDHGHGTPQ